MSRYNYNQQVQPAAPFVYVNLKRPDAEVSLSDVPAQLDTAADITVLPGTTVEALGLVQIDEIPIMGFAGHVTNIATFLVELQIRELASVTIEVLGSRDESFVLLGRDVLNNYRVVLNGPNLRLEIG